MSSTPPSPPPLGLNYDSDDDMNIESDNDPTRAQDIDADGESIDDDSQPDQNGHVLPHIHSHSHQGSVRSLVRPSFSLLTLHLGRRRLSTSSLAFIFFASNYIPRATTTMMREKTLTRTMVPTLMKNMAPKRNL